MPENRKQRTLAWVVALSTAALVFDGYDLVVYGTVLPTPPSSGGSPRSGRARWAATPRSG
jgi:hypothetical protein